MWSLQIRRSRPSPGKPKPVVDDCQSDMRFFVEDVWTQVLAADCASCHSKLGAATKQGAKFVLVDRINRDFWMQIFRH